MKPEFGGLSRLEATECLPPEVIINLTIIYPRDRRIIIDS